MKRLSLLSLLLLMLLAVPTHGQNTNRAGLVLVFGDGSVETQCVNFAEESISGYDLLMRSSYDVIAQPSGNNVAVCKIGGMGCDFPAESCFCKFGGAQRGEYWSYWQHDGAEWRYATHGAGLTRVAHGDVEVWVWETGERGEDQQVPEVSFDQVCVAQEATAEPPATPAATPVPATPDSSAIDGVQLPTSPVIPATPDISPSTAEQTGPASLPTSYAVFGMLLLASLGAIGLAVLRARR